MKRNRAIMFRICDERRLAAKGNRLSGILS